MKTKILLTTIMLALSSMMMTAQTNMFDKLSGNKNISTVYISKALLSMVPNMDMGGADIKGLAGKLEQMEIYSSENNKDASKLMRTEIESMVKAKTYETLMSIKDKDDNITFYAHKDKNRFKDLIMFINQPDECTIIRIVGNFTAEDIQSVMNSNNKK